VHRWISRRTMGASASAARMAATSTWLAASPMSRLRISVPKVTAVNIVVRQALSADRLLVEAVASVAGPAGRSRGARSARRPPPAQPTASSAGLGSWSLPDPWRAGRARSAPTGSSARSRRLRSCWPGSAATGSVRDVCGEHQNAETLSDQWRDRLLDGGKLRWPTRAGRRPSRPSWTGSRQGGPARAGLGPEDLRAGGRGGTLSWLG
jgi:hypothetical protein